MKRISLFTICLLNLAIVISSCRNTESLNSKEPSFSIKTSDIDNFWQAFDSLTTSIDSALTMQKLYIDKASPELKEFLKDRWMFTADEYVKAIKTYPKFWNSVRSCTENINANNDLIKKAFTEIKVIYPEFETPNICFVITPILTGGTSSNDNKTLFIGAEIVMADSSVNVSEFSNVFKHILGTLDLMTFIVHEGVHTAQTPECEPSVFSEVMTEGSADFITSYILKKTFNNRTYQYGYKNECAIWNEIKPDMDHGTNYEKWFGRYDINEHPDLGYFIGYRIVESFFEKAANKDQALIDIIKMKSPKEIFNKSLYSGNCNN
jgi:hypothetical protein